MLANMKDILADANEHGYAVMAMNAINMEMIRAGIEAATEEHSAIILQAGPAQIAKHIYIPEFMALAEELALRAPIPVCLNLDHGAKLDLEIEAIQAGFTNVMIDASSLPYEENIQKTKTIVALAHSQGISVEAELGHVGNAAAGDGRTDDMYTNVEQAKDFVARTGVDALAVAIGTAHGEYPKGYVPKLDFGRLAELKEALQMPLVLHGGSGSGEENLRKAVAGGINKVNVATDAQAIAKQGVLDLLASKPEASYMEMEIAAEAAVKAFVKNYMHIIGSNDRYIFADFESGSNE